MPGQHRIHRKPYGAPIASLPPTPFEPEWARDPSKLPKDPPHRKRRQ